ncbi:MAG: hypothetical protein IJ636_07935, partial [Bacteroidales bacterium]|nr:hypothetical protein [Bacteroidales bacterium]
ATFESRRVKTLRLFFLPYWDQRRRHCRLLARAAGKIFSANDRDKVATAGGVSYQGHFFLDLGQNTRAAKAAVFVNESRPTRYCR